MYKTLLASALSLALSAHAMARDYQFEGTASYLNLEGNGDFNAKVDSSFVSGTYYFSPVKTDNHPLAEAAFLGKNSSTSLVYAYLESKGENFYQFDESDITKFTYANKSQNLIFSADGYIFDGLIYISGTASHSEDKFTSTQENTYTNPTFTTKTTVKEKDSEDSWHANLGIAPAKGLLIWSGFEKDVDITQSWNLNAKYLVELSGKALSIQGGIGENSLAFLDAASIYPANLLNNFAGDDESDLNSAYVLGDYYFDNTFSLGLGATYIDSKHDDEDNSYIIRSRKFFTDSFSVLLQYNQSSDYYSFSIGASLRF